MLFNTKVTAWIYPFIQLPLWLKLYSCFLLENVAGPGLAVRTPPQIACEKSFRTPWRAWLLFGTLYYGSFCGRGSLVWGPFPTGSVA